MKAEAIPTTPGLDPAIAQRIAAMKALRRTDQVEEQAAELADAAGLMALAVEGVAAIIKGSVPCDWVAEALRHGADYVHDRAERLAAKVAGRPTRWLTSRRETWQEAEAAATAAANQPEERP